MEIATHRQERTVSLKLTDTASGTRMHAWKSRNMALCSVAGNRKFAPQLHFTKSMCTKRSIMSPQRARICIMWSTPINMRFTNCLMSIWSNTPNTKTATKSMYAKGSCMSLQRVRICIMWSILGNMRFTNCLMSMWSNTPNTKVATLFLGHIPNTCWRI